MPTLNHAERGLQSMHEMRRGGIGHRTCRGGAGSLLQDQRGQQLGLLLLLARVRRTTAKYPLHRLWSHMREEELLQLLLGHRHRLMPAEQVAQLVEDDQFLMQWTRVLLVVDVVGRAPGYPDATDVAQADDRVQQNRSAALRADRPTKVMNIEGRGEVQR